MPKRLLLFLSLTFSISILHAGGFQVNAQGQRQMGMGHCGTGLCFNDGSNIFFNPGAMGFTNRNWSFTAGSTLLFPRTVYLEPAPGIYTSTMVHHVGTPAELYIAWKPDSTSCFAFGVGFYTPFGSRAEWPNNWKGQFLIREIDLKTYFIQPTVSYKINEHIGIGIGFVYATGDFLLRKAIPVQDTTGAYGEATLNGAASGIGFNGGLFLNLNEHWSAGITYRSSVKVNVKNGTANFVVPSSLADYFPQTTFSTSIKLPSVLSVGIGYSIGKLKLAVDVNSIGWHSYDTLRIDFAENTDKLADVHDARCYKNVFISRIGVQYALNPMIDLRAGAYYDISPVKDGYLTPETPDANRIGLTCGASFHCGEKFSTDISLLYIEGMKRTDTNLETGFSGTYKSKVLAPGIGFNYAF
jgi:long-chain fatty acid transport protein